MNNSLKVYSLLMLSYGLTAQAMAAPHTNAAAHKTTAPVHKITTPGYKYKATAQKNTPAGISHATQQYKPHYTYYVKISGEVAFPVKAEFDTAKAPVLDTNEGAKTPHAVVVPGIAVGYVIPGYEDFSAELAYRRYGVEYEQSASGKTSSLTLLLNNRIRSVSNLLEVAGSYNFYKNDTYASYLRLGVGVASRSCVMQQYQYNDSTKSLIGANTGAQNYTNHGYTYNTFAFSAGVGVETDILPRLRGGIGYNYQNLGTTKIASTLNNKPLEGGLGADFQKNSEFGTAQSHGIMIYAKYAF